MNYPVVVGASLGATVFFALATALKHRSARTLPDTPGFGPRRLLRFIVSTASHPWWLAGLLADVGGLTLQVYALHVGAVSVVQPLLVTALLFSLLVNHLGAGTRISREELMWSGLLVLGLAGFLVTSGATAATGHQAADHGAALLTGVLVVVLGAACVIVARRLPSGGRAALVGVAVGTVYACTAVLIKACTNILSGTGVLALLTSWQLYVLVVSGATGLVLAQLAFRSGPLNASLPAIATVDLMLSVALGVIVYDEQLRTGAGAVVGEIAFLLLLVAAAVSLSRVEAEQAAQTR